MRSSSDRKLSRATVLLLAGWLTGALAIGLWVALLLRDKGVNWVASVHSGACVGVVVSWFVCFLTWHICMRVTRGAPFQVGDQVVITDGPLKGEAGEVREVCEGRCSVWVALARGSDTSDLQFFDWDQIRRSGRGENRQTNAS
ncbi:MAG: hypothetical protein KatS3mg082_3074 [Nitrospiraceae bacterium]|nr:MAG: hypothetical protein KatS3mg082_3074 [Nitrospiraceae bacterium]